VEKIWLIIHYDDWIIPLGRARLIRTYFMVSDYPSLYYATGDFCGAERHLPQLAEANTPRMVDAAEEY
jgi:hypothetical protein